MATKEPTLSPEEAAAAEALRVELTNMTGTQRAAVLTLLLGEQQAAEIIKYMDPKEVQSLGGAMVSVADVSQEAVNAILDDFVATFKKQSNLGLGTTDYVEKVMKRALGDDKAASVLGRIMPGQSSKGLEVLQWMDARSIAELVQDEHPQIVALIVSYLDFGLASDVLGLLDTQMQSEVIIRIATLEMVDPAALKELEKVMQSKFKANTSLRSSQVGGVKAAAKIMNFTKETMEKRILNDVKKADKDLMQAIQDNMFTFDNLGMSDDRSLQTLLRSVEMEDLILSLKGADEFLKDKLFGCMSTRAAANIQDEMEALGPIRLTEVQNAQKRIIAVARKMSDEGTIVLAGRGGDEMV